MRTKCVYCKECKDGPIKLVGLEASPVLFCSPNCLLNWFMEKNDDVTDDFFPIVLAKERSQLLAELCKPMEKKKRQLIKLINSDKAFEKVMQKTPREP